VLVRLLSCLEVRPGGVPPVYTAHSRNERSDEDETKLTRTQSPRCSHWVSSAVRDQ